MKIIKHIILFIIGTVGFLGGIASISGQTIFQILDNNNTKQMVAQVHNVDIFDKFLLALPYIALILIVIVYYFFRERIFFLLKSYNPWVLIKILKGLHEFQHVYIDNMRMYKGNENKDGINEIGNLIEEIRKIFAYIDNDISINFKVFLNTNKNTKGSTTKSVENTSLVTFVRARSERESQQVRQRKNKEEYKVQPYVTAEELHNENGKGCKIKKCNSAFNEVIGPNQHYYISNNLLRDEKNKKYFNSGENWKDYYTSIAIFLVAPRQVDACGTVGNPYALLIADSPKKYVFIHKSLVIALMGYFSHRMYSFMRNTIAKS